MDRFGIAAIFYASELYGLRDYNLTHLSSRLDIGMLGMLHRVNLGIAAPHFLILFPKLGHFESLSAVCVHFVTFKDGKRKKIWVKKLSCVEKNLFFWQNANFYQIFFDVSDVEQF